MAVDCNPNSSTLSAMLELSQGKQGIPGLAPVDTFANLPDSSGYPEGAIAVTIDTGVYYKVTSGSWVAQRPEWITQSSLVGSLSGPGSFQGDVKYLITSHSVKVLIQFDLITTDTTSVSASVDLTAIPAIASLSPLASFSIARYPVSIYNQANNFDFHNLVVDGFQLLVSSQGATFPVYTDGELYALIEIPI